MTTENLFTMNMVVIIVKGPTSLNDREADELTNRVEDVIIRMESAVLEEIQKIDSRIIVKFDT